MAGGEFCWQIDSDARLSCCTAEIDNAGLCVQKGWLNRRRASAIIQYYLYSLRNRAIMGKTDGGVEGGAEKSGCQRVNGVQHGNTRRAMEQRRDSNKSFWRAAIKDERERENFLSASVSSFLSLLAPFTRCASSPIASISLLVVRLCCRQMRERARARATERKRRMLGQ